MIIAQFVYYVNIFNKFLWRFLKKILIKDMDVCIPFTTVYNGKVNIH